VTIEMARNDSNGQDGLAEGPEGDKPMAFLDHVGELRKRLIHMSLAIAVGFFACFSFRVPITNFLRLPLDHAWSSLGLGERAELQALSIQDPLMVDVRVVLTASIFVTLPYLFLQLWLFIAPGLFAREKRFVVPFVLTSMLMFVAGAAFAFTVVLPFIYEWMIDYSLGRGETIQLELHNYFKSTTRGLLMFGLVFEFPLLVAFLAKVGVVTEKTLIRFWRISVVVIFILAGVLTPPDPISIFLMAIPMCVLYFASVGVAWLINPAAKVEAAMAQHDEPDEPDEPDPKG
jgi:sec-independent protein translocase protein TatC